MFKFYFSVIFLTMVYSIEQNTFIVVSYFRSGRFIEYLLVYHVCFQDGKLCLLVANDKLDGK
jgi:outer membrane lipopolysaccharide assembly protein LptE/RlpB